jgi:hypothetical protein
MLTCLTPNGLYEHIRPRRKPALLIERLSNGIGADKLYRVTLEASDVPERAVTGLPLLTSVGG